jgi:hypothetical protein
MVAPFFAALMPATGKCLRVPWPCASSMARSVSHVVGRRPCAHEGLAEARVFAGDAPCHSEQTHHASARLDARHSLINGAQRR